jgi:pimeloyl-ACP methyl ester carboxylesterase
MTAAAPTTVTKAVTTSDGVRLPVEVTGDGPPVILLHGFPDSMRMWDGVTPLLAAAGRRVVRYDQRGFGGADAPTGRRRYRIDRTVQDLVEVLDALEIEDAVDVVGHDWGALVSWATCLTHPERARRHVTVSVGHPTAFRSAGLDQKRRSLYIGWFQVPGFAEWRLGRRDMRGARHLIPGHPTLDSLCADLRRPGRLTAGLNWYRANVATLFTRRWPSCTVPTLGIMGGSDPYLTVAQIEATSKYMVAPFTCSVLPDGGHWLPLEDPDRVADLIDGFLAAAD